MLEFHNMLCINHIKYFPLANAFNTISTISSFIQSKEIFGIFDEELFTKSQLSSFSFQYERT